MKILLTTVFDYPHLGGLSTHITTLKEGLEARGHNVSILSFSDIPYVKRTLLVRGPSFILNKMSKGSGIVWSHNIRQNLFQHLLKDINTSHYDVINAQDVIATLASIETGIPTVSTVHGYLAYEAISNGSVKENSRQANQLQKLEIKGYQKTRKVITVDQRIKDYINKNAGVVGNSIQNFINIEDFKPTIEQRQTLRKKHHFTEEESIFFVPRRLTKKNGVIYPLMALPSVLREHPKARLVYAGTGEMLGDLKSMVHQLKLENHVSFLGAIPHDEMKEYYGLSNVVLVPSVHSAGVEEATSISALEAMGSGLPLIACAVGGLREIVQHEVDGLLVEEKNITQLSDAMIRLLDYPELGQQFAKKARLKIEKDYSHLSAAEKYEEIYQSILD